jgi:hypothetical protein
MIFEGVEYQVLCGALATLANHKPVVVSELLDSMLSSTKTNSDLIVNLLKQCGYRVTSVENPGEPVAHPYGGEIPAIPEINSA